MRIPQSEKFLSFSRDIIRLNHRNDSRLGCGFVLCNVFMALMRNHPLGFDLFHITWPALRWSGISEYEPHFFARVHLHRSISE